MAMSYQGYLGWLHDNMEPYFPYLISFLELFPAEEKINIAKCFMDMTREDLNCIKHFEEISHFIGVAVHPHQNTVTTELVTEARKILFSIENKNVCFE